jgi:hypothetical protein
MQCHRCGSDDHSVIRTTRGDQIDVRECVCNECHLAFRTEEKIIGMYSYQKASMKSEFVPIEGNKQK